MSCLSAIFSDEEVTIQAPRVVSPTQFKIFRFLFGIYLAYHFFSLTAYAIEMFGPSGMIDDPNLNPTWNTWVKIVPDILIPHTDTGVQSFVNMMVLCSIFFTIGILQRLNALILWYGWAYLFNRNNFIGNPGLAYVGWLLLACTIVPNPGTLWEKKPKKWEMPILIFWSAWFLMALGYTISGIHKLQCKSWRNGSALFHVLLSVLSRDTPVVDYILDLMIDYPAFMRFSTWSSLFLEISFLFLGLFDRLRFWYWISFMIMHLGILTLINFTDLTLGVLTIHLFTFDNRWLFSHNRRIKLKAE